MQVNSDRENISLEEALAFLKFINKEKPFNKEDIVIPTRDYVEENGKKQSTPTPTPKNQQKKVKQEEVSEDLTKKINKNRAIKRIIESAYEILQKFSTYEDETGAESSDKSSQIQLSIYLKQYNRVLENIYKLEKARLNAEEIKTQNRQQVLQNIFEYTVVEDFRQILPVAVLKDKISKTNIQIMIESLSKSLVTLKPNELRIYDSTQSSGSFKSIKLNQIENVDYHTQPHILMVLSILKDKERFNIYLQFQSEKNQEKWDRALYCCYIGRKMKTKEKFFLIQYPEEDVKKKEKEETKNLAAFQYQMPEKKTPIVKIMTEKCPPLLSEKSKEDNDNSDMRSRTNTRGHKKQLSTISKQQHQSQVLKPEKSAPGSDKANKDTKSNKFTNNDGQTNRFIEADRKQNPKNVEVANRTKTDYIQINKEPLVDPAASTPHKEYTDRDKRKDNIFDSLTNEPLNREELERENEMNILNQEKEEMPEDIIEIHNLERKHVKGIILQKEKFFFNKAKKVYLKEGNNLQPQPNQGLNKKKSDIEEQYESMKLRQLWYLDYDSKTGEEINPKLIKLINIKDYFFKDDKMLTIIHDKQISFSGDLQMLKEIKKWIDLVQSTYKDQDESLPRN